MRGTTTLYPIPNGTPSPFSPYLLLFNISSFFDWFQALRSFLFYMGDFLPCKLPGE